MSQSQRLVELLTFAPIVPAALKRDEIVELHYILPIKTVPSIAKYGILSHNGASKLKHDDISMSVIQDRRVKKQVPGGLRLHDYANLYFNARNKMMAKKRLEHDSLCVLRIAPAVLDVAGAVIADQNASSNYVLFLPSPAGLQKLHKEEVFVRSWKFPDDQFREWRLGSIVCAELLIPYAVGPEFIEGAYVLDSSAVTRFTAFDVDLECTVNRDIFLR